MKINQVNPGMHLIPFYELIILMNHDAYSSSNNSNIPSYSKFIKDLCTPFRKPKRVHLLESASSILLNDILGKRRDHGTPPLLASKMGEITFNTST